MAWLLFESVFFLSYQGQNLSKMKEKQLKWKYFSSALDSTLLFFEFKNLFFISNMFIWIKNAKIHPSINYSNKNTPKNFFWGIGRE